MRKIGLLFGSVSLATVFIGPANAGGETFESFKDCRPLTNHEIRLACYDTFADGKVFSSEKRIAAKKESFGKLEKPQKVTVTRKTNKVKNPESMRDYDDDVSEVELEIVKSRMNNIGTVTLWAKNGQIWRQLGSDRLRVKKVPFKVVIRQNMMGGYSLNVMGRNQPIRVKRIK